MSARDCEVYAPPDGFRCGIFPQNQRRRRLRCPFIYLPSYPAARQPAAARASCEVQLTAVWTTDGATRGGKAINETDYYDRTNWHTFRSKYAAFWPHTDRTNLSVTEMAAITQRCKYMTRWAPWKTRYPDAGRLSAALQAHYTSRETSLAERLALFKVVVSSFREYAQRTNGASRMKTAGRDEFAIAEPVVRRRRNGKAHRPAGRKAAGSW